MAATHIPNITGGNPMNPGAGNTATGESSIAFDTTADAVKVFDGATLFTVPTNRTPVVAGGATLTLTAEAHAGRVIALDTLAGTTITLPAATGSGVEFTFLVTVAPTSNQHRIDVVGNDAYFGTILADTDADSADLATVTWAAPSDADRIDMNGTTKGGRKGDFIRVVDMVADGWHVFGAIQASGTEVTPFTTGAIS